MERTEEFKKYLAGMIDGDGCIYFSHLPVISITQKFENYLNFISSYYDRGKISKYDRNNVYYALVFNGKFVKPILEDILPYLVIKKEQCRLCLDYLNGKITKEQAKKQIHEHNQNKYLNKDENGINFDKYYLAGLFDAEGCITIGKGRGCSLRVKLTQKNYIPILHCINKMYDNTTKINNYACVFWANNCVQFLQDVLSGGCIIKKEQIELALIFCSQTSYKDTKEYYYTKMQELKRVEPEINKNNKIASSVKLKLTELNNYTYEELLLSKKLKQNTNLILSKNLNNKIYNDFNDLDKLNVKLKVCETKDDFKKFNYYRDLISSLPRTQAVGRQIRIMVFDTFTDKLIGLLCLTSPAYRLNIRDTWMKTEFGIKIDNEILNCITDVSCCVPCQPFGFNTNGGKLLIMLCFSDEVKNIYYKKYNKQLKFITTTSINGKGVMYSRIPGLKYLGNTRGYGTIHLPEDSLFKTETRRPLNHIADLCKKLNLNDITFHDNPRGFYIGNCEASKNTSEITKEWKDKYAFKRYVTLKEKGKLKIGLEFYTKDKIQEIIKEKGLNIYMHLQEKKIKKKKEVFFPEVSEEMFNLIEFNKNNSTKEISKIIKENCGLFISPNVISKILRNNLTVKEREKVAVEIIKPLKINKRNCKSKKYSDEEIDYLKMLICNEYTTSVIKQEFEEKICKSISLNTVIKYSREYKKSV